MELELLKFERYVVDNKKLVLEANALTKEINAMIEKRETIIERIEKFKIAMKFLTDDRQKIVSAKKVGLQIEYKSKKKTQAKPRKPYIRKPSPNFKMIENARRLIPQVVSTTDKHMTVSQIMEKLYDEKTFDWTLSRTYLDGIIREMARKQEGIKKDFEGFIKVD